MPTTTIDADTVIAHLLRLLDVGTELGEAVDTHIKLAADRHDLGLPPLVDVPAMEAGLGEPVDLFREAMATIRGDLAGIGLALRAAGFTSMTKSHQGVRA